MQIIKDIFVDFSKSSCKHLWFYICITLPIPYLCRYKSTNSNPSSHPSKFSGYWTNQKHTPVILFSLNLSEFYSQPSFHMFSSTKIIWVNNNLGHIVNQYPHWENQALTWHMGFERTIILIFVQKATINLIFQGKYFDVSNYTDDVQKESIRHIQHVGIELLFLSPFENKW